MKNLLGKSIALALLVALASCENEEVVPQAYSDAFIITKMDGENAVHGLFLHTYSNLPIASVVAKDESNQTHTLGAYNSYDYEFYWETDADEYTEELPRIGAYDFTVNLKNQEVLTNTETLTSSVIEPVEISACTYNTTNNRIEVTWAQSTDADYIVVILRDPEGNAVYYGSALVGTVVTANITTSGWLSGYTPEDGETYTVEVNVFMLENSDSDFLQSKAISSQTVVWGEE